MRAGTACHRLEDSWKPEACDYGQVGGSLGDQFLLYSQETGRSLLPIPAAADITGDITQQALGSDEKW